MMDKRFYADIKYSKLLADDFQDAEEWWGRHPMTPISKPEYYICNKDYAEYPAIHTGMVLEKLPSLLKFNVIAGDKQIYQLTITKTDGLFAVFYKITQRNSCLDNWHYSSDKNLTNALCEMYAWLKQEGLLND